MVRYLKQSLTSKTMEPLQVYSDSAWTDVVLLFCFFLSPVTNHHKLDAHNKPCGYPPHCTHVSYAAAILELPNLCQMYN